MTEETKKAPTKKKAEVKAPQNGPEAWLAALAELKNPKLTAVNPHYKNRYAPLDEVMRTALPTLHANKLNLLQTFLHTESGLVFSSVVQYVPTGECMAESIIPATLPADPQKVGSATTYYRRYGALLVLNLAGEEDDDAEGAMERKPAAKKASVSW